MMTTSLQCIQCVHYRLDLKCDAFPDGIPEPIILGEHDHHEPYPGDHGIRWEPIDESEDE